MFNPQLATFVCVADCGSFSQAAEKLYLSSTAVMKQLTHGDGLVGRTLMSLQTN